MLRCKFAVESITKAMNTRILKLRATNSAEGDNKDWSQWTACGMMDNHVTNEIAWPKIDAMKPGDLYFIDIAPVT